MKMHKNRQQPRASYDTDSSRADCVLVIDRDDGHLSVTNDAEKVVAEILEQFGVGRRIIYRDTMGRWDELKHDGKRFTGFAVLSLEEHRALGIESDAIKTDGAKRRRRIRPTAQRVRRCRVCGCTDNDCSQCIARTGRPCSWVGADLCSACVAVGGEGMRMAEQFGPAELPGTLVPRDGAAAVDSIEAIMRDQATKGPRL
jgi:hypothetical protein